MTWPKSSGGCSSIAKIAVAGVLIAIPTAAVSVSVLTMPGFGGTSNVLGPYGMHPAQPPAAPSTDAPAPPAPAPAPAPPLVAGDYDWWSYGAGNEGAGGG
jgi:hypothetical protein